MKRSRFAVLAGVLLAGWAATPTVALAQSKHAGPKPTPEQVAFFEKSIRPVLVKECYSCHASDAKKIRGGLTLDTRAGIRAGGDTGPAVVPGNLRESLLLLAIKHADDDLKMPPEKKLSAEVIANFEKWIAMGAPDPRDGAAKVAKEEIDIEKGRQFWSFQPVGKVTPAAVKDVAWPRSDIDRFLLAKLEAKGLKPVADADPRTLVRRLYFDLVGLPPTPEDIEPFLAAYASEPQAAINAALDKLLASPQFGERWGRHWLDVVRYAESSGKTVNFAYPHAWRYRDYVIAAFNADKPYDEFIREQLAGDLLSSENDKQKAERLVATGFLAIGAKTHDEFNRRQFQMDLADEQIDVTFQAFQALTVACARCHDHKFDPIPQRDYYAVAGIFTSTETHYGTIRVFQNVQPSRLLDLPEGAEVPVALSPLSDSRRDSIEKQIEDQQKQMRELRGQDNFIRRILMGSRVASLRSQLDSYDSEGTPKARAMGVRERRGFGAGDSRIYIRGELDQPGERVRRGFPQVLTTKQPNIRWGSGRRQLADFIASAENPLTARVMANRVWLHLVGRGLVPTPDNFGASGLPPSHPELLDHLANAFVDGGWSVKKLIRTIALSRAYGLSSRHDERNFETDPDNVVVWRIPKRRLEVEALRDTMLLLGGRLDLEPPVGNLVARGGEGNVGFRLRGDYSGRDTHRTVYLPIVRDQLPDVLTIFDFPDPSLIIGQRASTTIPAQSLYMMNNTFVIGQAQGMADGLLRGTDDDAGRLRKAYLLCYSRPPSDRELSDAEKFLEEYGKKHTRRATWAALCQALFASAEFSHR